MALLRPLRVEQLLLRVLRCDTVGPYRLPRDAVCAIDEALARIAVTIGEGDGDGDGEARGLGARLLGEVPSLHAETRGSPVRPAIRCSIRSTSPETKAGCVPGVGVRTKPSPRCSAVSRASVSRSQSTSM